MAGAADPLGLGSIVEPLMNRQRGAVPELFAVDESLEAAVRRSTEENVALVAVALRRPGTVPRALAPGPRLDWWSAPGRDPARSGNLSCAACSAAQRRR